LFMVLLGAPAVRQYYVYVTDNTGNCKKMGTQCWVFLAINFMELLVNLKFGFQTFTQSNLSYMTLWTLFVGLVCAIGLYTMAAMSELCQFLEVNEKDKRRDVVDNNNDKKYTKKGGTSASRNSSRDNGKEIEVSSCSSDDEDADIDSGGNAGTMSFLFRRNQRYVMGDLTDTTDTDGDRGGYFPSAARLRQRIVNKINEFQQ